MNIPTGNTGVYDPTEIHNRGQLKRHMRDCMIYLGYNLIIFFVYLYWYDLFKFFFSLYCLIINILFIYFSLIISLLQGDPLIREDDNSI